MTKIIKLSFISLTFLTILSSCKDDNRQKIHLILKSQNNPFFLKIKEGVRKNFDNKNYKLIVQSGKNEQDVSGQIRILKSILDYGEKNIAGVILTPSSSGPELVPYILQLQKRNIPIVIVDTDIDKSILKNQKTKHLPTILSNNKMGGELAAHYLIKENKELNKILILGGVENQKTAIDRRVGFEKVIKTNNPNLKMVYRTADWNRSKAMSIVSNYYNTGTEFDGIFAANDEMAIGCVRAILNSGVKENKLPTIIGFDAIDEAKKLISKGHLSATIQQHPINMGERAYEKVLMKNFYSQTPLFPVIETETTIYD